MSGMPTSLSVSTSFLILLSYICTIYYGHFDLVIFIIVLYSVYLCTLLSGFTPGSTHFKCKFFPLLLKHKHHISGCNNFILLYKVTYDPGHYLVLFENFYWQLFSAMVIVRT